MNTDEKDMAYPPFNECQIKNFNEFQESKFMHPFTCGKHSGVKLIMVDDRLVCPIEGCDYEQRWCWKWMIDGRWKESERWVAAWGR